jgi:hypothetical protein
MAFTYFQYPSKTIPSNLNQYIKKSRIFSGNVKFLGNFYKKKKAKINTSSPFPPPPWHRGKREKELCP